MDCINRIRLEFKGSWAVSAAISTESINRIRLEFKAARQRHGHKVPHLVLIESDWNLKPRSVLYNLLDAVLVLIESDWNLKCRCLPTCLPSCMVLIESDWNLKFTDKQIDALWKIKY